MSDVKGFYVDKSGGLMNGAVFYFHNEHIATYICGINSYFKPFQVMNYSGMGCSNKNIWMPIKAPVIAYEATFAAIG